MKANLALSPSIVGELVARFPFFCLQNSFFLEHACRLDWGWDLFFKRLASNLRSRSR